MNRRNGLQILLGMALCMTVTETSLAQGFGNGELQRAIRPGAYVPYDNAPYSHRYYFDQGYQFFPHYDSANFAYQEYLDRLDRQQNFGHLWPSAKYGPEYQVWQIERDYWQNSYGRYGDGRCGRTHVGGGVYFVK
jgi:hypothetical protein